MTSSSASATAASWPGRAWNRAKMKSALASVMEPLSRELRTAQRASSARSRTATWHRSNWYDRSTLVGGVGYVHLADRAQPPGPYRPSGPRGAPAADLRQHPPGDPRRGGGPRRPASVLAGDG